MIKISKVSLNFNQKNTAWLRGLSALLLVYIHSLQSCYTGNNAALLLISKCGFLCVSVYFFLSGYGLIVSEKTKKKYIDGFLWKRCIKIFIPVYLAEILYVFYYLLCGRKEVYDLISIPFFYVGWSLVGS